MNCLDDLRPGEDRRRAAGHRAAEHERAHALRGAQHELLGDHPAERHAEDVRRRDAEVVEEAGCVVRHLAHRVGLVRLVGAPGAAVVEGDYLVLAAEGGDLAEPARRVRAQTHDQEQRFAAAANFVVEIDAVYPRRGHRRSFPDYELFYNN